ncbi:hypothetical protein [Steroidobacter denitrificans]|uniref:hypothetical protein n=1 Tax=Steroidobacter denitrificans TaxID=465721 RepID=UPI001AEFCE2A|nr:hypothetical protein [Steroidobacter denitrificans]
MLAALLLPIDRAKGLTLMAIPSLSQHLLATAMIRGDDIPMLHVTMSAAASLLAGAVLIWLAMSLYRRESILVESGLRARSDFSLSPQRAGADVASRFSLFVDRYMKENCHAE